MLAGMISRTIVLLILLATVAGCGGPARDERVKRCGPLGLEVDSPECDEEVALQRQTERCLTGSKGACDDPKNVSANEVEREIRNQVQRELGGALRSVECGEQEGLAVGDSISCSAAGLNGIGHSERRSQTKGRQ